MINFYFIFMLLFFSSNLYAIEDLCPKLPQHLLELRPKLEHYISEKSDVSTKAKEMIRFADDLDKFKSQYPEDFRYLNERKKIIYDKMTEAEKMFYQISPYDDGDNFELLQEIKSTCWGKITGTDEFEKGIKCHPLDDPPTPKEWLDILVCTKKTMNILDIRVFK